MNQYSSKPKNPQSLKKTITNYLLQKPKSKSKPYANMPESPTANFQSISSLYLKQKHFGIQSKITQNSLTNSMKNIGAIKAFNQGSYLNHSSSKVHKADLCVNRPLSNSNSALANDKALKCPEASMSMNIFNSIKEEAKAKDSLIKGLKNKFAQNKMKLKQILTTNVSQDCSIINQNSETSPNKSSHHQSNALSMQIQHNKKKKGYKTNSLYINTSKDNEFIPKGYCLNKQSSSQVNCVSDSNSITEAGNLHFAPALPEPSSLGKVMMKLNDGIKAMRSKTKRYNYIKATFQELIALYPVDHQRILEKVMGRYHDVVLEFAKDNKRRKESNEVNESSKLFPSYYRRELTRMEHKVNELTEEQQRKEKEIERMKKRLADYEKALNPATFSKSTAASPQCNQNISEGNEDEIDHTRLKSYFLGMKEKNIEDLDSLYFFDKVPKGSSLVSNKFIPHLNLKPETIQKPLESNNNCLNDKGLCSKDHSQSKKPKRTKSKPKLQ